MNDWERYLYKTYSGQELLKKHKLIDHGVWQVYGEDPNCDMGGCHSEPYLGTFEGRLSDVVEKAVTLPKFWCWGGGGSIKKVNIEKL